MLRVSLTALAPLAAGPALADIPVIADSTPWTISLANGREVQTTLNPDGTGRMRMSLLSRGVTWTEQDGAICLDGMLRVQGTGCLTPTAVEGGWRLSRDGGEGMVLTR